MAAQMQGRVCLVTGANSGIGLETARGLARAGATVIMGARDPARGAAAVADVARSGGVVQGLDLDLADLGSVRRAAEEVLSRHAALHVLVANAGAMLEKRQETADGFEASFGVNHLGHFLLVNLLLERLRASAPARVVVVSSDVHRMSKGLDFDDLMRTRRRYTAFAAYADSKLANVLFTVELARRLEGSGVSANCLHPGAVASRIGRDGDMGGWFGRILPLGVPFLLSPAKGALTSLHLAMSEQGGQLSGRYFVRRKPVRPSRLAQDAEAARRLWAVSEALVGLHGSAG